VARAQERDSSAPAILSGDTVTIADLPEDIRTRARSTTTSRRTAARESSPGDAGHWDRWGLGPATTPAAADAARAAGQAIAEPISSVDRPIPSPAGRRLTLKEYRESRRASLHRRDPRRPRLEHLAAAAIVLGVERTNLHKKIRAYGIKRGEPA